MNSKRLNFKHMKTSFRFMLVAVTVVTALAAQAQLKFCDYDVTPGKTYTKSDISLIKSGSFKLNSSGTLLEINNLVVDYSGKVFYFTGTSDITVRFIGESTITRTGWATGTFVFGSSSGIRHVTITGDKAILKNTYRTGPAFMYNKNCVFVVEDCYIDATSGSGNYTNYFVEDNNVNLSTTSRVEIRNATVKGNVITNILELVLQGCNFVVPKSYPYLAKNSYGFYELQADGETVADFTILPTDKILDGDVNHDGKVNVSDITTLINKILGIQ